MKSDTDMIRSLREAINDYAAGVEDRYGGSKLSTVLAILRAQNAPNSKLLSETVYEILKDDTSEHYGEDTLFIALGRVAKELGLRDSRIAAIAEQLLTSVNFEGRPKASAQLVELFVATGGDLTPKLLESLAALKASETRQWAYFAIKNAYVGDAKSLARSLSTLPGNSNVDWKWDYFVDNLDDILQVYGIDGLELVFKRYAEAIKTDADKEKLYSFYQDLTGRDFRPRKRLKGRAAVKVEPEVAVVFLSQESRRFLTQNPKKAKRAIPSSGSTGQNNLADAHYG